ncbi:hypothetical protein [Streptomyces sp. TRM64462]|uniref:hypothetical protein n=1 Tax=Streptomyces sp. TRM64462 TaxID=2741726 RepID=UPI001586A411|nr:hypothetical protein [Streptomyces sp. TRM64462]
MVNLSKGESPSDPVSDAGGVACCGCLLVLLILFAIGGIASACTPEDKPARYVPSTTGGGGYSDDDW